MLNYNLSVLQHYRAAPSENTVAQINANEHGKRQKACRPTVNQISNS